MLMAKTETLKVEFEKQATHIDEDMRIELNAQNVGGDLYKAGCVLEKPKLLMSIPPPTSSGLPLTSGRVS